MNYSNADSYCQSTYGTHLATITSSIDNEYALIAATNAKKTSGNKFWIGYNDIENEGNFTWIDGTINTNYTNLKDSEPSEANNGENKDCANMETNGEWKDTDCAETKTFICNVFPNTSTPGMSLVKKIFTCCSRCCKSKRKLENNNTKLTRQNFPMQLCGFVLLIVFYFFYFLFCSIFEIRWSEDSSKLV